MNKILSVILLSLALMACTALHRGIPKAPRHHQTVVAKEAIDLRKSADEESETSEQAITSGNSVGGMESEELAPSELVSFAPASVYVDETRLRTPVNDDTLESGVSEQVTDDIMRQAEESERIAKNALISSIVSIAGLLFFPLLLGCVIGTLILSNKFKKLEYVSEVAQKRMKRARRIALIMGIIAGVVLLIYISFILFILFLF